MRTSSNYLADAPAGTGGNLQPAAPARCPLCDAPMRRLFVCHGHWISGCWGCGHRTVDTTPSSDHVARVYGDDYFHGGGAGYTDYCSEAGLLRAHGRRYAALLERHMAPGRVLDVGAAAGFILEGLLERGWTGTALEPNAAMAASTQARLGIDVWNTTLETCRTNERFDLVMMIQVVAHFVRPKEAFAAAKALTRPGGFWLIETWNRNSWMARLFGKHWHEYSPPSVLHWFSKAGLRRLAAQFDFREVAAGRPAKRLSSGHAKSLARYKLRGTKLAAIGEAALALVPDALELPYPSFDLFWMLFQDAQV